MAMWNPWRGCIASGEMYLLSSDSAERISSKMEKNTD